MGGIPPIPPKSTPMRQCLNCYRSALLCSIGFNLGWLMRGVELCKVCGYVSCTSGNACDIFQTFVQLFFFISMLDATHLYAANCWLIYLVTEATRPVWGPSCFMIYWSAILQYSFWRRHIVSCSSSIGFQGFSARCSHLYLKWYCNFLSFQPFASFGISLKRR